MRVLVSKEFNLNLGEHGGFVHYKSGVQEMPEAHFRHWYAQRIGVEKVADDSAAPVVADSRIPQDTTEDVTTEDLVGMHDGADMIVSPAQIEPETRQKRAYNRRA